LFLPPHWLWEINILTKDESVVVSINGKWGVGKTYFWHKFKGQLTDKKVAYVKNTSKLGKSNCASLCFCPHIGSGK
jgi:hypothetical protein